MCGVCVVCVHACMCVCVCVQDQYEVVCSHTDQGIEFIKRVSNFVKDRIHAEQQYARELRLVEGEDGRGRGRGRERTGEKSGKGGEGCLKERKGREKVAGWEGVGQAE